jgi:O2-independent ubiquinone biosynthesis protein UbiV
LSPLTLTLGPILFHWPASEWMAFYRRVAEEPCIDRVCIGEIVCSKRWPFINELIPEAVDLLLRAGKTVLLSPPILPTLERERRKVDELVKIPGVTVEANDISALTRLSGRPHAIGPFINTYNEDTLRHFVRNGAATVCLPPELPLGSVHALAAVKGVALEAWAFGRIPLAISARCYHARLHRRSKDACQFVCGNDPDGRLVEDLSRKPIMAINGVQTLSATYCSVIDDIETLAAAGVASLRLSPCSGDMNAIARLFRDVVDRRVSANDANRQLAALLPSAMFSNGFLHSQPGHQRIAAG